MPRGNGTVSSSSDSTGWRKRYCDAATANANVLTASSRPRTRSAPTPMSAASAGGERTRRSRWRAGTAVGAKSRCSHATDVEVACLASKRGREQRAEPGEGHLPERQLARPSGEDRQRQPADREARDRRVQQVPRRLRDRGAAGAIAQQPAARRATIALSRRTHQTSRSCSGISRTLGANENVWVSAGPRLRLWSATAIEHGHEQQTVDEAGLVEVVEVDQRLHDADRDAGDASRVGTTPCRR